MGSMTWLSIADVLPAPLRGYPMTRAVLLYASHGGQEARYVVGAYDHFDGKWIMHSQQLRANLHRIVPITLTHWCELPQAPNG